jgi:site-specific DNA-methyltransferase (adenine-specific)
VTPYYADDLVQIFHGDCREWMPEADVIVTDPPYGLETVAGSYGRHGDTIEGDLDTASRDAMLAAWGPHRPILIFSTARLAEPPGQWDYRLVWDKAEPGLNGGPWRYNHEPIFVRGDGWVRTHHFSILRYPIQNGSGDRGDHPHRKPVPLMRALLGAAPPGLILDPFMGSGTTLRAAKDMGRRAIGIEIEERFCEIAANRCRQEVLGLAG